MSMYNTFYDLARFAIWSERTEDGKNPRIALGFRDGNPRLVVSTGEQGMTGMINFPMDHYTFSAVIEAIRKVANSEAGFKLSIESLGSNWVDDKPQGTKVISTLHIGKTKEGVVYLSVIEESKQKIVFLLKPTRFHIFRDDSKTPLPDSEVSVFHAKGLANFFDGVLSSSVVQYTADTYKGSERKPVEIKPSVPKTKPTSSVVDTLDLDDEIGF